MRLEDKEAAELLELLFTNDNAELLVGQPEGIKTTTWFVAVPKPGGGITQKGLSPRASILMAKLLGLAPVEEATPAVAKAIEGIVKKAAASKAKHPTAKPEPEDDNEGD